MMGDPFYQADFFAYESVTIDATAGGIALTAATYGQARIALITVETAQIRWTIDGTAPVAGTTGHLADVGDTITLKSSNQIARFRGIRTGGTSGTLRVSYAR